MTALATGVSFRHAASINAAPAAAFDELEAAVGLSTADAVILFVSAEYDLDGLAGLLRSRVTAPLLCCTTAGEISSDLGYTTGGIAAAVVNGVRAKLFAMTGLAAGESAVDRILPGVCEFMVGTGQDDTAVGLLVVDGLSKREELVIDRLHSAMPTVPLVGGSAGDGRKFKQCLTFIEGRFQSDSAALLLIAGDFTAIPFQTHHFVSSGIRVVATEVDPATRRVIRLDGLPVRQRLAAVMGCPVDEVTIDKLATRPLMLRCGDFFFVRSAHLLNPDGSISMFCAIHEGEILHVGSAGEIVDTTESYFDALRHQQSEPDLVIGFDCVLRRLELELRGRIAEINDVVARVPIVGFSTFGEQYDGQHVNQTMTGVALWTK